MQLSRIRDTASKFAAVISRVLDADVMIIDTSFTRVANTFRYVDGPPPVSRDSVTARAITTGKVVVVQDRKETPICRDCAEREDCCISQLVAVPIFYASDVAGAIDLLVPAGKHSAIFDNLELTIDFLERMADLLSSKLRNLDDYERLQAVRKEREIILDFMEDAIVYTTESGNIVHWNGHFERLMHVGRDAEGRRLDEIVDHPLIRSGIESRREITNEEFSYKDRGITFSGLASVYPIQRNAVRYGMIFLFKSMDSAYGVLEDLARNRSPGNFEGFLAQDTATRTVVETAKQRAVTEDPLLISGPPGSGKSTLARAVHLYSDHGSRPFVVIECSGFSASWLEEEIFGPARDGAEEELHSVPFHETRDSRKDPGLSPLSRLRIARDGSVFFRHIEALPLYLQKRLTSILRQRHLSGSRTVHARLLFSSSAELVALSRAGLFDEELAVRISGSSLSIPPLAERRADIPGLIALFAETYGKRHGRLVTFGEETVTTLSERQWPQNVRQLERAVELAAASSPTERVDAQWLENRLDAGNPSCLPAILPLIDIEKTMILKALEVHANKDDAARALGIGRATLYRKIKEYSLTQE